MFGREGEFIDISTGEPVGEEIVLFNRPVRDGIFSEASLERLLRSYEAELDSIIDSLVSSNDISTIFWNLTIEYGGFRGKPVEGGGFLDIGEKEKKWILRELRDSSYSGYKASFREAIKEYDGSPINSEMKLVGFGDKIFETVKAKNPNYNR